MKSKNGRTKDGWIRYKGVDYEAPQGHFQIRYYVGGKAKYLHAGKDAEKAESLLLTKRAMLERDAMDIAALVGEEEDRPAPERAPTATPEYKRLFQLSRLVIKGEMEYATQMAAGILEQLQS